MTDFTGFIGVIQIDMAISKALAIALALACVRRF
jgi:hypothetical protein